MRWSRRKPGRLTCREVGRKLQTHLDGELDPAEAEAVADHLHSCVDCGFEADVYQGIKDALRRQRRTLPEETVAWVRGVADSLVRGDGAGGAGPAPDPESST